MSDKRTKVIRAKVTRQVEFVGAVHRYWQWEIPNPVGGELGLLDFGCAYELAEAHDAARRAIQRTVAAVRWAAAAEGFTGARR